MKNTDQQLVIKRNRKLENEINIVDLLRIVYANWYWFALSVFLCLVLGFYYIKITPQTYSRTASVLIKDEGRGAQLPTEAAAFEEMNMLNSMSTVDNEVLIFKSKRLMIEVARRLKLDISYKQSGKFRDWELYTHSPVQVSFPEATEQMSLTLSVTPVSEKEVLLSGFPEQPDSAKTVERMTVALNDTVETPVGKLVVTPSLYYSENYYGIPIKVAKRNLEVVALACNAGLQATLASKMATIINLTLNDVSPQRAEDIINTLIDVYNEDAINDKNQIAINTANFINDRLIIIEKELGGVDTEIADYKRENQLTDITSESRMYLQSTSTYQQEGLGLENQQTLSRYIRDYLTDPSKAADLIPANTGLSDTNIEGQIRDYNELLLKRDKLIGNSSDRNPVVQDMNNSLAAMRQTIIRTVDNLIAGLNMKIKNVRAQEARTSSRIAAVPTQQKYVLSVERQQKIKEALYLYLLNKREENALSKSITESNARVIDPAMGSNIPIAPKTKMILLASLVLGIVIPAGVLWAMAILDTAVRTRKDIEDNLTLPFLGEIPFKEKVKKEADQTLAVSEKGKDAISEAFRIVRTNMDFMSIDGGKQQVIMTTSLNADAGKTFISSNLAVTLAMTGKKVVLVDLDIRKGTLSKRMHRKSEGVTNYLLGTVEDLRSIIHSSEFHPNLDIIYDGPVPPNPAELLLGNRLDKLVEELKEMYDYVILDNVPSNMVADAAIVNRVANLTIYVVRAGMMDRRQLAEVEKLYTDKKFKNMAVVLNGVKYSRSGYGHYGYYGRYGYYGYGYGNDTRKKRKKIFGKF
ncbi:GumC family protein [Phocaeicola sp.]